MSIPILIAPMIVVINLVLYMKFLSDNVFYRILQKNVEYLKIYPPVPISKLRLEI